jgi:hypothetical protein
MRVVGRVATLLERGHESVGVAEVAAQTRRRERRMCR